MKREQLFSIVNRLPDQFDRLRDGEWYVDPTDGMGVVRCRVDGVCYRVADGSEVAVSVVGTVDGCQPMNHADAMASVQAMFPGKTVEVCDGDETYEGGLVMDGEETIASFQFTTDGNVVTNIAVGAPGQYCGTVDEFAKWNSK